MPEARRRWFHCCLFDRECREDTVSMRDCVVRFGRWQRTFHLPGWKKYRASWIPVEVEIRPSHWYCDHFRDVYLSGGASLETPPTCGTCGPVKPRLLVEAADAIWKLNGREL